MSQVNLTEGDRRVVLEAIGSDKLDRPVTDGDIRKFEQVIYEPDSDEYRKQQHILAQALALITSGRASQVAVNGDDKIDPQVVYNKLHNLSNDLQRGIPSLLHWAQTYSHWDQVLKFAIDEKGDSGNLKYFQLGSLVKIAALGVENLKTLILNTKTADLLKESGREAATSYLDLELIRLGHEGILELHLQRVSRGDSTHLKSFIFFIELINNEHPGIKEKFEARLVRVAYTASYIRDLMADYGHLPTLLDLAQHISQLPKLAALYRKAKNRQGTPHSQGPLEKYRQAMLAVDLKQHIGSALLQDFPLDVLNEVNHPGLEEFLEWYAYRSGNFFSDVITNPRISRDGYRDGPLRNFLQRVDLTRVKRLSAINPIFHLCRLAEIGHPGVTAEIDRLFETEPQTLEKEINTLAHAAIDNDAIFKVVVRRAAESPFMFSILYYMAYIRSKPKAVHAIRDMDVSKYAALTPDQRVVQLGETAGKPHLEMTSYDIWCALAHYGNEGIYEVISTLDSKDISDNLVDALIKQDPRKACEAGEAYFKALGKLAETREDFLHRLFELSKGIIRYGVGFTVPATMSPESKAWAQKYLAQAARINPAAVRLGSSVVNILEADVSYYIERLQDSHPLEEKDVYWEAFVAVYRFGDPNPNPLKPFRHGKKKNEAAYAFAATITQEHIQELIDANPIWLSRAMDLRHLNRLELIRANINKHPVVAFMAIVKFKEDISHTSRQDMCASGKLVDSLDANFFKNSIQGIPADNPKLADRYVGLVYDFYSDLNSKSQNESYNFWECIAHAFRIHKGRKVIDLVKNTIPESLNRSGNKLLPLKDLVSDLMLSVAQTDPSFPGYGHMLDRIRHIAPEKLATADFSAIKQAARNGDRKAIEALKTARNYHIPSAESDIDDVFTEAVIKHPECIDMLSPGTYGDALLAAARQNKQIRDLLVSRGTRVINNTSLERLTYDGQSYIREYFGVASASALLLAASHLSQSDLMDQVQTTSAINTIEHVAQAETDSIKPSKTHLPLSVDLNTQDNDLANWRNVNLTPVRQSVRLASLRKQSALKNAALRRARSVV